MPGLLKKANYKMASSEYQWDVQEPYIERVTVQPGDIDQFGHANNVSYLGWLERVAWSHSNHLGLDFAAYEKFGCGCVVRRHELDYLAPTFAGDELLLATFIHENDGRLSMWRGYQIIRAGDGKTVMRARTQWVCVDLKSGKPRRQPAEFVAAYKPAVPVER